MDNDNTLYNVLWPIESYTDALNRSYLNYENRICTLDELYRMIIKNLHLIHKIDNKICIAYTFKPEENLDENEIASGVVMPYGACLMGHKTTNTMELKNTLKEITEVKYFLNFNIMLKAIEEKYTK